MNPIRSFAIALVAVLGVSSAAAGVITPTISWNNQSAVDAGGLRFTASANARNPTFKWATKEGVNGVGISGGRTNDEIDIDETLTATTLGGPFSLSRLVLGLLYDGPEFGDVQEVARITGTFAGGGSASYELTATWLSDANGMTFTWNGPSGSLVTNLQPAKPGSGAVWGIDDPFGDRLLTSFSLTAMNGSCPANAPAGRNCSNQSDFIFMGATVPAPGVLALMSVGLIGIAALRRRTAHG